jgi:site-specific DNA-methyltransferase (adenine-specific)
MKDVTLNRLNSLFYGDNLPVLRNEIGDESVDLIYLDPPFNSQASYNVLFKSPQGEESRAQIEAFGDTWHWGEESEQAFDEVMHSGNSNVAELLRALRSFLKENDVMAYLAMMSVRLLELHRVLKPTGSIYLHCDHTAGHYLRLVMDAVFGPANFRSEITWQRTNAHSDSKGWSDVADVILYYVRDASTNFTWNPLHQPHSEEYVASKYRHDDGDGRLYQLDNMTSPSPRKNMMYEWKGHASPAMGWRYSQETMTKLDVEGRVWYPDDKAKRPRLKRYLDEMKGTLLTNIWGDILPSIRRRRNDSAIQRKNRWHFWSAFFMPVPTKGMWC